MEIQVTEANGVAILRFKGRLDLSNGSTLMEQVKKLFEDGKTNVHLNLTEVEFINSSGLGALVSILKETKTHKGRLTLSNLASYVQQIFEITQLSTIFEIFASQDDALASHAATTD